MNRVWPGAPWTRLKPLLLPLWLVFLEPISLPIALAQTTITGTIFGRVFDSESPAQAGLDGATLILTNPKTGRTYKSTSNQGGYYSLDILPPGLYVLSCELQGFENLDGTLQNVEVKLTEPTTLPVPPFALRKKRGVGSVQTQHYLAEALVGIDSSRTSVKSEFQLSNDWSTLATAAPIVLPILRSQKNSRGAFIANGSPNAWRFTQAQTMGPHSVSSGRPVVSLFAMQADASPQSGQTPSTRQQPGTPPRTTSASPGTVKLVNGINATRGGLFTDFQLLSLPLQGTRTFDELALLLPGVVAPPQTLSATPGPGIGSSVGTAGQFSVNGLPARTNNFTVDGSDNNDEDIGVRRQGFTALVPQSIESVNQLYISTLLPAPQFGRNMGAQVNAVSHYGGNRYHGMVYGILTDKRLNARDFFDYSAKGAPLSYAVSTAAGTQVTLDEKPLFQPNPVEEENPFTRVQYGLVLGGPLSPSRKSFFFSSLERQQINARKESHFAVPTVDERGLNQSGGTGLGTTRDQVYPTSVIGDAFFSLFPFPNNPIGPYGKNTYTEVLPASADGTIFSLKVDQNLGQKHLLTGRYNLTDDDTILPVTGEALFSSLRPLVRTQNLSLFLSSVTSRLSNEGRFSFGRTHLRFDEVRNPHLLPSRQFPYEPFLLNSHWIVNNTGPSDSHPTYSSTDTEGSLLGDVETAPIVPAPGLGPHGENVLPIGPLGQVIVSGFSPIGVDVFNFPQERANNTFQYADTFIYKLGRHRITAGFDCRRTQLNSNLEKNFRPLAAFNGARNLSTDLVSEAERQEIQETLGFAFDNPFLLGTDFVSVGSPTGFFQTQGLVRDATIGLRYWESALFFSDQIQVNPAFILTLGARYDYNTVPTEVNKRIEKTFTDPELQKLPDLVRVLNGRTQIYESDPNNFAPQMAFAWDPWGSGKTSVRAGYGIFYDQILGAVVSQSRNVFPSFVTLDFAGLNAEMNNNSLRFSNGLGFINPVELAAGSLNTYNQSLLGPPADLLIALNTVFSGLSSGAAGAAFTLPAANLQTPYSQHWALTIEREFKGDFVASAAYVGTRGLHLLRFAAPNLGPNAIPLVRGVDVGRTAATAYQPLFQGSHVAPGFDPNAMTGGRPAPLLGSYTSIESDANSVYHSLQLQLNKRFSNRVQFTTAYTWSHAIDEVSDLFNLAGTRTMAQNGFSLRAERGDANFDVRHRFVYSAIWNPQALMGHKIFGGWQFASIGTFQTGRPYSNYFCCDSNSNGSLDDSIVSVKGTVIQHASRNLFRSPGVATVDLAVNKRIELGRSQSVDFRCEFFNLFNRTHFGIPVNQDGFPAFGNSVDTRVAARMIQIALKYSF
jgi:Carboxypeptidase regulatory-like domain/TonB dependent receptor-like, beta-barrel